jgi:hypothetical protein
MPFTVMTFSRFFSSALTRDTSSISLDISTAYILSFVISAAANVNIPVPAQVDSYKIKLIMQKISGWAYSGQKKKIKGYGAQYVWVRASDESTPQSRNLLEP